MRNRHKLFTKDFIMKMVIEFFVVTACVCILNGVVGMIFLPKVKVGYEAFLSPPFFGICSLLCGIILETTREITMWQMLARKIVHLLLIELMVFGLNYSNGMIFGTHLTIALVIGIAVVYSTVGSIMYMNDRRCANQFNEQLKLFQMESSSK